MGPPNKSERPVKKIQIGTIVRWIALINIIFCLGIAFTLANYPKMKSLQNAIQMVWAQRKKTGTGDWFFPRYAHKGLLRHDAARSHPGYTLFTVVSEMSAYLVDPNGRIAHRWDVPVVNAEKGIRTFFGALQPHIDSAEMFPNGDLLVAYAQPAVGEYGSTVARLDMNGNLIWRYQGSAHHTVKYVNGKIYTLTGKLREAIPNHPVKSLSYLQYLDDAITVLDENGRELETHSVIDMIINSEGLRLADLVGFNAHGDPLHANDIEVLTEETYRFIPNGKPGDVLLSVRHLDAILLADLVNHKITWVLRGTFRAQHDIDVLPNGNVMLFDNEGDITDTGKSRVLEIDPRTGGIVWSYNGTQMDPMYTENRGSQQRLPNGNTMINESNAGRIFEVTPDGDVVWEYIHPVRGTQDGKEIIASIGLDVVRYDLSYAEFLKSEVRREASR